MTEVRRRAALAAGVAGAAVAAVAWWAPGEGPDPSPASAAGAGAAATSLPPEVGHVHALAVDPGSGAPLIASHSGLYVADHRGVRRVGPSIDLMGFTVISPGHYLASGHPQPGTDLPEPVGLVESRDAGRSWRVLSRGGESDFHVLAAMRRGVLGFDGTWRTTKDHVVWSDLAGVFEPISLATSSRDDRVLASDDRSLWASADGGRSWTPRAAGPAPALLSRSGEVVVALTADGRVHLGDPSGQRWRTSPARVPGPLAVTTWGSMEHPTVLALGQAGLVVSRDGADFVPWVPDGS